MITVLLLGAGVGLGAFVLVRSLRTPAPPLAQALAVLDRPNSRRRPDDAPDPPLADRVVRRIAPRLARSVSSRATELRVTGRTAERHAAEKLAASVCGVALPVLLALLLRLGGVAVAPAPLVFLALGLGVGGWLLPDLSLRDAAAHRRRELRHALSSYLDLVNVVLAGGAGVETALEAAADAGDGWAFAELRAALARSRVLRRSPWQCFEDLGDELGVVELAELSASVRLAGEQGARIKSSLSAKAASLRGHQLAEVEAAAQSASERMALPTVLMFVGFLLFIGYPAVAEILGGSGL